MNLTNNTFLRTEIRARIKELEFTHSAIVQDANERGININSATLSKYINNKKGGLTEEHIIWLATRLGIYVHLNFGEPIFENNKLVYRIPKFNEIEAIKAINRLFKKNVKKDAV